MQYVHAIFLRKDAIAIPELIIFSYCDNKKLIVLLNLPSYLICSRWIW